MNLFSKFNFMSVVPRENMLSVVIPLNSIFSFVFIFIFFEIAFSFISDTSACVSARNVSMFSFIFVQI